MVLLLSESSRRFALTMMPYFLPDNSLKVSRLIFCEKKKKKKNRFSAIGETGIYGLMTYCY